MDICSKIYWYVNTVEPLIKDSPSKGQPLYKGHFQYPQKSICNTLSTSEKRSTSIQGTMAGPNVSLPRRLHCIRYISYGYLVIVTIIIIFNNCSNDDDYYCNYIQY